MQFLSSILPNAKQSLYFEEPSKLLKTFSKVNERLGSIRNAFFSPSTLKDVHEFYLKERIAYILERTSAADGNWLQEVCEAMYDLACDFFFEQKINEVFAPGLRYRKETVRRVLLDNYEAIKWASSPLQKDPDFSKEALSFYKCFGQFKLNPSTCSDQQLLTVLATFPEGYRHIPAERAEDESFQLRALTQNPEVMAYLPREKREDPEFVLKVISWPITLQQIPARLAKDPEFMLAAIRYNRHLFFLTHPSLRKDSSFLERAYTVAPNLRELFRDHSEVL